MTSKVRTALENVKAEMKRNGYEIGDIVQAKVDPNLDFMGYTMPMKDGRYQIVVSGASVDSGMLEGLLTHEMSHVYRMETRHPSHNGLVIEEAVNSFGRDIAREDYQQKMLHDILNDIQDLYADDLAFKVLRKAKYLSTDEITKFLQSWLKEEPYDESDGRDMARWTNGAILVHNARALAQMTRHNVPDTGGKAARMNDRFLAKMPSSMTRNFDYFRETLVSLSEDLTTEAYSELLKNYIGKFLDMVHS